MKKTLTVNLGGIVYQIDEDAYRLLDNYLNNLRLHFRKEEGADEIMDDMETRISDLFSEKINEHKQVIVAADVEEIIARMGKPEEIESEEDETEQKSADNEKKQRDSTTTDHHNESTTGKRRLYRDPDNRMLGGVASGFGAYLDCDPTWVRLIMIILIFIPYTPIVVAYLIAWLLIPEARTATEKLSMHGEAATVENIGKSVSDGFNRMSEKANDYIDSGKSRSVLRKIVDMLISVAAFLFKAFLVMLVIICFPVLFVLAIVLLVLVAVSVSVLFGGGAALLALLPAINWAPLQTFSPMMTVVSSISMVLLVGIPLAGVLYAILRQFFHWSVMSTFMKWALLIVWLIALVVFCIGMYHVGGHLPVHCYGGSLFI